MNAHGQSDTQTRVNPHLRGAGSLSSQFSSSCSLHPSAPSSMASTSATNDVCHGLMSDSGALVMPDVAKLLEDLNISFVVTRPDFIAMDIPQCSVSYRTITFKRLQEPRNSRPDPLNPSTLRTEYLYLLNKGVWESAEDMDEIGHLFRLKGRELVGTPWRSEVYEDVMMMTICEYRLNVGDGTRRTYFNRVQDNLTCLWTPPASS